MKKKVLIKLAIIYILFELFFNIQFVAAKSDDAEAFNDLVINNITVSSSQVEIDTEVTYTLSFTTKEEISRIEIILYNEKGGSFKTGFDLKGNVAELKTKLSSYGEWKIEYLYFQNTDGKSVTIYNSAMPSYEPNDSFRSQDMSEADVKILNDPEDTEAPKINISSIKLGRKKFLITERTTLSVKITDNYEVNTTTLYIEGPDGRGCTYSGTLKSDGLYYFEGIYGEVVGKYQIVYISAMDKSGNETKIGNSKINIEDIFTQKLDLSYLDFTVATNQKEEHNAPVINIESFKVNKKKIGRNDFIQWSFSVTDESRIGNIEINFKNGNSQGLCGTSVDELNDEGKYTTTIGTEFYGTYKIANIKVTDIFGNITVFKNTAFETNENYLGNPTVTGDLSSVDVEVGIYDEKNRVFAIGEGLDSDVTMTIEDIEQSGRIFDKLHSKDYNVSKFLEIHMNGVYNRNGNKVRLEFYCGEENEGKKYRIRHLLSSGDIQEEEQIVKNGMIYIWVDEFSPFMIENQDISVEETKKLDDEPKTGNNNNESIIALIAVLIAILGIKFLKKS